jgi:hypothetical protein
MEVEDRGVMGQPLPWWPPPGRAEEIGCHDNVLSGRASGAVEEEAASTEQGPSGGRQATMGPSDSRPGTLGGSQATTGPGTTGRRWGRSGGGGAWRGRAAVRVGGRWWVVGRRRWGAIGWRVVRSDFDQKQWGRGQPWVDRNENFRRCIRSTWKLFITSVGICILTEVSHNFWRLSLTHKSYLKPTEVKYPHGSAADSCCVHRSWCWPPGAPVEVVGDILTGWLWPSTTCMPLSWLVDSLVVSLLNHFVNPIIRRCDPFL